MLNIKFIARIAKRYPSLGRTLETALILALLDGAIYLFSVISGRDFSSDQLLLVVAAPIMMGLGKLRRDISLNHQNDNEYQRDPRD